MKQYVFRPRRRLNGKLKISRLYSGRFQFDGMPKCVCIPLGVSDKQVAEKRLAAIVTEKQWESVGIVGPRKIRDGSARNLVEHLRDYAADLSKKGRDDKYTENVQRWVRRLAMECGWQKVADITADGFISWRSRQKKAARTLNHYLEAGRAFLNWLQSVERIAHNPLARIEKVEERGAEVRERRALTDDEVRRLLKVAGERKLFYLTAVFTGLRRAELEQLEWGDVIQNDDMSALRVRGSTTKNKKSCLIQMHAELTAEFRKIKPASNASERVFNGARCPTRYTRRSDFERAGIAHRDQHGRVADLHSLRHTLNTRLQRAGVPMRVAMEVMRHSDVRLTAQTYTDAMALPVAEAVSTLPCFIHDAHIDAHGLGAGGHLVTQPVIDARTNDQSEVLENEHERHDLASSDTKWQSCQNGSSGRIRT